MKVELHEKEGLDKTCSICLTPTKLIGETVDYFLRSSTQVHYCEQCDLKFVPVSSFTTEIYDELYSSAELGYHHDVTKDNLSLEELIQKDINFAAVFDSLEYDSLDILEIGCGYGFLTNALKRLGHRVKGIDVSCRAIEYARKMYGEHFEQKEITTIDGLFDLIIAIEVIEHIRDPYECIKKCAKLLKQGGKLIITTPNKDYYKKSAVWVTNPPPVHLYWFGKKAMEIMAKRAGLEMQVLPMHKYLMRYEKNRNLLLERIRYRNQMAALLKPSAARKNATQGVLSTLNSIALCTPIKETANFLYSLMPVTKTLALTMTKV